MITIVHKYVWSWKVHLTAPVILAMSCKMMELPVLVCTVYKIIDTYISTYFSILIMYIILILLRILIQVWPTENFHANPTVCKWF